MATDLDQFVHIVRLGGVQVFVKQRADLLLGFVDGRHDDVRRFFPRHLHDVFAHIALDGLDVAFGEIVVQLDFLADHRFAFDHQGAVLIQHDLMDDGAGLLGGFRPMYLYAQACQVRFQLCEQLGQLCQ